MYHHDDAVRAGLIKINALVFITIKQYPYIDSKKYTAMKFYFHVLILILRKKILFSFKILLRIK